MGRKTALNLELQFGNKSPSRWWAFCFAIIVLMDKEPDTENVVYMDEYPELAKKVWLRRLAESRLSKTAVEATTIIYLPEPPDGAA